MPDGEPEEAAQHAELLLRVHVVGREVQQHDRADGGQQGKRQRRPRTEGDQRQRKAGIDDELRADRPARLVPGIDVVDAGGVDQQRVGQQRLG